MIRLRKQEIKRRRKRRREQLRKRGKLRREIKQPSTSSESTSAS